MSSPTVSTRLAQIAEQSKLNPGKVFTTIAHMMDAEFLQEAFKGIRKNAAAGLDRVTAAEYAKDLPGNLEDLHGRLKTGKYRAQPARRQWIPKSDGKKRPLAILVLEDKVVQRAVTMLLNAIYEPMFYEFSQGFRPKRGAHHALDYLRKQSMGLNINWIVDADISGFFDNIDRTHLRAILKSRVNDGSIIRLIGKWLHAGVMENGKLEVSDKGTQQGGSISPMLANIFLHTVLDEWFEKEVRPRMGGRCFIVRFADDFVVGFEYKSDAEKFYEVLPKRLGKYGLSIHPTKSRLVQFSEPGYGQTKGVNTFDFLGFTHYWGKTRKGGWSIKRKTQKKKLHKAMTGIWDWCKHNRHLHITEQSQKLRAKLLGHYQYYGVRDNYQHLRAYFRYTKIAWKHWLSRRTSKGKITWKEFDKKISKYFPLPRPRIVHQI